MWWRVRLPVVTSSGLSGAVPPDDLPCRATPSTHDDVFEGYRRAVGEALSLDRRGPRLVIINGRRAHGRAPPPAGSFPPRRPSRTDAGSAASATGRRSRGPFRPLTRSR